MSTEILTLSPDLIETKGQELLCGWIPAPRFHGDKLRGNDGGEANGFPPPRVAALSGRQLH